MENSKFIVVDDATRETFAEICIYPEQGTGYIKIPAEFQPCIMIGDVDKLRAGLNRPCAWYGKAPILKVNGWFIVHGGYAVGGAYKEYDYKIHFVDGVKVEEKVIHTFGKVNSFNLTDLVDMGGINAIKGVFIAD